MILQEKFQVLGQFPEIRWKCANIVQEFMHFTF